MKVKIASLVSLFLIGTITLFAQVKTEKFKVYGNCSMCKSRIEKAAKTVDGVTKAEWDKETKIMEVTFDETKTDSEKIQQAIADVGHDTELKSADNKTYKKLPNCCLYDRKVE